MGWILIRDLETGQQTLLGEPENCKSMPPEELGMKVYVDWRRLHPNRTEGDKDHD